MARPAASHWFAAAGTPHYYHRLFSIDETVYFDNLQVTNNHGVLLEEDHYYAYGLKIAGISSKVLPDPNEGFVQNKNLYNDKELIDEADLDWYDYGFRNYDPQIGRFTQLDSLTDDYRDLTPYQYASDEPIANVDIDGLEGDAANFGASLSQAALDAGENSVVGVAGMTTIEFTHRAAHVAKSGVTAASMAGSFLKGVGQSLWGAVKGIGQIVAHPITTVSNVASAVAHPVRTFQAVKKMVKETYKEFKEGDANTRMNILGKMTGEGLQLFAGGPILDGVKAAEKVGEGAKIAEKFGEVAKDLEKTEEIAHEASNTEHVLDDVSKVERGAMNETRVPCGCFLPGTLVLTDSGYKRIEQIRPGDVVMAYNDTTHSYGRKKVIRIFEHVRDTVYQLIIGADVIRTTSDHPFFVGGRWMRVKELHAGDSVTTYSGSKLVIASIRLVVGRTAVHNFEVADFHTYYVSKQRVLVHNNGPCDVTPRTPHSSTTSGNNPAAEYGKQVHKEFAEKVKAKEGWQSEPSLQGVDGKIYRPDAVTPEGDLIELKPRTARGISRGRAQARKYQMAFPGRKVRVIYYTPK